MNELRSGAANSASFLLYLGVAYAARHNVNHLIQIINVSYNSSPYFATS